MIGLVVLTHLFQLQRRWSRWMAMLISELRKVWSSLHASSVRISSLRPWQNDLENRFVLAAACQVALWLLFPLVSCKRPCRTVQWSRSHWSKNPQHWDIFPTNLSGQKMSGFEVVAGGELGGTAVVVGGIGHKEATCINASMTWLILVLISCRCCCCSSMKCP